MQQRFFILLILLLFEASEFRGQCPVNDTITETTIRKVIAANAEGQKKLSELLSYCNKIIQCHYKKDSLYARVLNSISICYNKNGNFSAAVNYLLESINISKIYLNNHLTDAGKVINGYYWLSVYYDSLNNSVEKRKADDSCIAITDRENYPYNGSSLRCLLDRLQHFYDIGDYVLCINDAEICEKKALQYVKNIADPGYKVFGMQIAQNSFHWHINALLQVRNFSEAETLLSNKTIEYKKSNDKDGLALTSAQLGMVFEKKGDYQQSLLAFSRALKMYRANKDTFNCKQSYTTIGEEIYFKHLKDYDKALVYYKDALECVSHDQSWQTADSVESLNIFGNIANVFVEKKLFDSAFSYFQLAFDKIKKGTNIGNILSITANELASLKKIDYVSDMLVNYGDAFAKKYAAGKETKDLEKAIDVYTVVDKLLAMINISQFEPDSKLLWRRSSRRLYENAIEACYLAKEPEKAFYFFERSRAVLLNIQLAEQNWMGKEDIVALAVLNKRIAVLNNAIDNTVTNPEQKNALLDTLRSSKDNMYSLLQLIKNRNPLYFQNQDTEIIAAGNLQKKLLKDQQSIIEVFSGDSAIYLLLVTAAQIITNKVNKADFEKTVSLYTTYLSNRDTLNKDFSGFRKIAHHLYELIWQNNQIPEGRIVVSPEGFYFPFESLISDNSAANPVYFISKHAVSYTYSARYLFSNFTSPGIAKEGNFLGVAPVNYFAAAHLLELPGSDLSLKNIKPGISQSRILVAKEASRNNFRQLFHKYKIIQLYTHASDSSDREEPVIYFADSALYLSELIPEQKPATELIVLSACETGNGKLYQGEGVFSFNRGFAALGIPSSVTNLWSINNESTYSITESFYKYLSKGLPLDIALQKAKLDYMNDDTQQNQLPYYWAAPILVGKTDAIAVDKPFAWKYLFAGIGLIALIFFGLLRLRKMNQSAQLRV